MRVRVCGIDPKLECLLFFPVFPIGRRQYVNDNMAATWPQFLRRRGAKQVGARPEAAGFGTRVVDRASAVIWPDVLAPGATHLADVDYREQFTAQRA